MVLSLTEARRLAVESQLLAGPRAASVEEVIDRLRRVQIDPVAAIARAEHMVLFSRLGPFDIGAVERLVAERRLFEYWAFLVPREDFAIHRPTMRRYPRGDSARARYVREWLITNAGFRRYILRELRRRGPLRSRELDDRHAAPWHSGGWNDFKGLPRMLDIMWARGDIAISGRVGGERLWDLAERVFPLDSPRLTPSEIARRLVESQLRARGVARRSEVGRAFDGEAPGVERMLRELERKGSAIQIEIAGLEGTWWTHTKTLEQAPLEPRTVLLSPFDRLIHDRHRAEQLWGFRYKLEMYVPRAKREFGYYVLPVLDGHDLVGRVDPLVDRRAGVLTINGVWAEKDAPAAVGARVGAAVAELATWVGATDVRWPRMLPRGWARALRAAA
jgi:uncharacterized protein YcaQ